MLESQRYPFKPNNSEEDVDISIVFEAELRKSLHKRTIMYYSEINDDSVIYSASDKAFNGSVVNQTCHFLIYRWRVNRNYVHQSPNLKN